MTILTTEDKAALLTKQWLAEARQKHEIAKHNAEAEYEGTKQLIAIGFEPREICFHPSYFGNAVSFSICYVLKKRVTDAAYERVQKALRKFPFKATYGGTSAEIKTGYKETK